MIYTVTPNPAVDRELTVPALAYDTVLRASEWRVDLGGKGFNVSRLLQSLGASTTALAFAGGRSGELLRDGLEALGIGTDFVWVDGETRPNVSIISAPRDHYIKVNEPGPTVGAGAQQALIDKVRALVQPGDWWVLSGSLPPGTAPDFYAELVRLIQAGDAYAILDTSGAALVQGCAARPAVVKPNETEAEALTGLPADKPGQMGTVLAAVHTLGPANVVISLGKQGAVFGDGRHAWMATTPTVEEGNPTGAGDSLVGGLAWGLSQGFDLPEAMRWAIACGAATASLPGTTVGSRALVESLVGQVEIRPILG